MQCECPCSGRSSRTSSLGRYPLRPSGDFCVSWRDADRLYEARKDDRVFGARDQLFGARDQVSELADQMFGVKAGFLSLYRPTSRHRHPDLTSRILVAEIEFFKLVRIHSIDVGH